MTYLFSILFNLTIKINKNRLNCWWWELCHLAWWKAPLIRLIVRSLLAGCSREYLTSTRLVLLITENKGVVKFTYWISLFYRLKQWDLALMAGPQKSTRWSDKSHPIRTRFSNPRERLSGVKEILNYFTFYALQYIHTFRKYFIVFIFIMTIYF